MAGETILIVDDEKEIRDLIHIYLVNEGFHTIRVSNGNEALELLKKNEVHLIILDIMMPGIDGMQTCIKIREEKNMPIIFLSAKIQDIDKITGLSSGADDYVIKPFNPLELVARVKSQLRRYMQTSGNAYHRDNVFEIDELVVNGESHEVFVNGNEIKLTPTEFQILELLSKNRGKVFSIEKIYETVWKETFLESDNTVMVHIRKIREKIERNPREPHYIKTVWGVGYKVDQ